jgi:hypothetical protein
VPNRLFSRFRSKENTKKRFFLRQNTKILEEIGDYILKAEFSSFLDDFGPNLDQKTREKRKKNVCFRVFVSLPKISTYIEGKTLGNE